MAPSISSLAAPSSLGPNLRPRSPTGPKPGFVIQSPDSRVSIHRPSSECDLPDMDSDGVADSDSVVEVTQAKDFLKVLSKKKRKKTPAQVSKDKARSQSKGCPRGSGALGGVPQGPLKKVKKAAVPVSLHSQSM